jgi:hypothetical protein
VNNILIFMRPNQVSGKIIVPTQVPDQDPIVNSKGEVIFASPVVLIDSNGEFASLSGEGNGGGTIDLSETNNRIGAANSSPASSDVGTFSINSILKRISQSFTSLLNRIPNLSNGSIPVEVSNLPSTQTITGTVNTGLNQPLTDTQLRASAIPVTINNTNLEISNDIGNPVPINGSVTSTQSGSWSVGVNNFPTTQAISSSDLTSVKDGIGTKFDYLDDNDNGTVIAWLRQIFIVFGNVFYSIQTTLGSELGLNIGARNSGTATDEVSNWSLNSLLRRISSKLPPALGSQSLTQSISTTLATNDPTAQNILTLLSRFSNRTNSGNLTTLNAQLQINTGDLSGVSITLSGTWVGTVTFQGTSDGGSTWLNIKAMTLPDGSFSETATTNGQYGLNAAGLTQVRVLVTNYTSGSISVGMLATKDCAWLAIRNTSLSLVADSNPFPIKQGVGELLNVGLNAGTNTIGNAILYNRVAVDQAGWRTISIPNTTTVNTWFETGAADLGSANGFSKIVLVPDVQTASTNNINLEFQIFFSNGAETNKNFEVIEAFGTPSGGISAVTIAVKTWTVPLNVVKTFQEQGITLDYKGRFLGIKWRINGAPGNTASIRFNARFM